MFSIDHRYSDIEELAVWWDGVPINVTDKVNTGRNTTIKLLKLSLPLTGPEERF